MESKIFNFIIDMKGYKSRCDNHSTCDKCPLECLNCDDLMEIAELSALTGIGKSSISQYLSGKNEPNDKRIQDIADSLECSVAFLKGLTSCSDSTDDPNGLKNVPVSVAAQRIGKSEQYVRVGLQRNILPFGTAVKLSSRYSYHISPKLLDEYIGA